MDAGKPDIAVELARAVVAEPKPTKKRGKSVLFGATALAVIAAAAYYGHDYWTVGRFQISTDDAYVQADNSAIAPKISGYITDVAVSDNQTVKAGQVLARIDDRDFKTALDQAKADVAAAEADVNAKQASLDMQQSLISAAQSTVDVDRANETFAEQNDKRYSNLSVNGYAPVQTAQQAASQIAAARAAIERDTASLAATTKQVDLLKAQLAQSQAVLAHDRAVQAQAELNLSYTAVVAPVDGVVGNRTLRVGQYVQAGT
ncbi:MAG: HlyD family secretion protein, partial [Rhizobiaceae bacterium]|nr:HlyD family secretion protein [Rhizobiaceae bacterium]